MNKKVFTIVAALLLVSVAGLFAQASATTEQATAQETAVTQAPASEAPAQAEMQRKIVAALNLSPLLLQLVWLVLPAVWLLVKSVLPQWAQ